MKTVSMFALCFLMLSAAAFADDGKPDLVKIQTIEGKLVWVTKEILKETYNEAFGKMKPKLSAAEKAKQVVQIRQDAYQWAISTNGLNLYADAARAFAEQAVNKENAVEVLEAYKAAYLYSVSRSGLNLYADDARRMADRLSSLETPVEMLAVFTLAYSNAISRDGMNLYADDARKYALKAVGLKP